MSEPRVWVVERNEGRWVPVSALLSEWSANLHCPADPKFRVRAYVPKRAGRKAAKKARKPCS